MEAPLPLPEAPTVFGQVYSAAAAAASAAAAAASASHAAAAPAACSMPPPPPRPPRAGGAEMEGVLAPAGAAGPPALSLSAGLWSADRPREPQGSSPQVSLAAGDALGNATRHAGFAVDELSSSDDSDGGDGGDDGDGGDGGTAPQEYPSRGGCVGEADAGHGGSAEPAGAGHGGSAEHAGAGHGGFAVDELSSSDGGGEEDEDAHSGMPLGAAGAGCTALDSLRESEGGRLEASGNGAVPNLRRSARAAPANVSRAPPPTTAEVRPPAAPEQSNTAASAPCVPVASLAVAAPIRPGAPPTDAGDRAIQVAMEKCGGDAVAARDILLAAGTIHFSYTTNALRARCQQLSSLSTSAGQEGE